MMTASAITEANYDPMFCLSEHLDYFNETVAGKNELLNTDFDEIFGVPMTSLVPSVSVEVEEVMSSPTVIPPSPKSAMITETPISPKPMQLNREQAVVSPTTVTSTAVFSEVPAIAPRTPDKPKPMSRKRKISEDSAASTTASPSKRAARVDPTEKEDIRRERNRQHAKRSRQRKRELMVTLEESVQSIKEENAYLFQILGLSQQSDFHIVAEREQTMETAANERFIEALKQPQNRVLSNDALISLRELINGQE